MKALSVSLYSNHTNSDFINHRIFTYYTLQRILHFFIQLRIIEMSKQDLLVLVENKVALANHLF